MAITVYFVRHGQTYLNRYNRMQGWSDAPLTEKGIEDAKRVGRALSKVKFDYIFSSDLSQMNLRIELQRRINMGTLKMPNVFGNEWIRALIGCVAYQITLLRLSFHTVLRSAQSLTATLKGSTKTFRHETAAL